MSNLTFDQNLVRKCTPEPLEGHTVVVLERVGKEGEKFKTLLQPGAERPRQNPFAVLLGKPNVYFAYAVDMSRGRSLDFTEHVQMGVHDFELHFSLWYRVNDPKQLVSARTNDPLKTVRKQVGEVVAEELAQQPWKNVWHAFRATSESVVADKEAELKSFARDYGLTIVTLRLRATFPPAALQTEKEILELQQRGVVGQVRIDVAQQLHDHRRNVRLGSRDQDEEERIRITQQQIRQKIADGTGDKLVELIRGAGSADELREIQVQLLGGSAGPFGIAGLPAQRGPAAIGAGNGHAQLALPAPGGGGLAGVLAELVALTECRPDGTCRLLRSHLLRVVAEAVADDSKQVSKELADLARRARAEIASASLPADRLQALQELTDPVQLRQRL